MAKLRSVVVGATGLAGQQFIAALRDHPGIEIAAVAASARSAAKRCRNALKSSEGRISWFVAEPLPEEIGELKVLNGAEGEAGAFDLAFSAVESDVARQLEPTMARDIPVISTASAFRYDEDVP